MEMKANNTREETNITFYQLERIKDRLKDKRAGKMEDYWNGSYYALLITDIATCTLKELELEFIKKARHYELKLLRQYKDCEKHYVDVRKIKQRRRKLKSKEGISNSFICSSSLEVSRKREYNLRIDEIDKILKECT